MQLDNTYSNIESKHGVNSMVYNMDCVQGMQHYPDKHFDLAIVDPPYGKLCDIEGGRKFSQLYKKGKKNWNNEAPIINYFIELFRVSKNQIIWGGNYFDLPPCRGFIVWDKKQPQGVTFSMAEYAWCSFNIGAKIFRKISTDLNRIHPTQKPIELYEWLLLNYANAGDKILDTHLGSGSSRIACYHAGYNFTAFEIDTEYCQLQEQRFKTAIQQQRLF